MTVPREPVRLGVLGGTFDPIHMGHLRSAEELRERFGLSEVLFVPAARPPHKEATQLIDPAHRLRMTEAATADNDAFTVSSVEIERPGPSYTVDTMRELKRKTETPVELYFIIGTDAFMEIHSWKDVEGLFKLAHIVVTSRPGHPPQGLLHNLEKTITSRHPNLKFVSGFDEAYGTETLQAATSEKLIYLVPIVHLDISSTDIRERVGAGRSIRYLVPESVEHYIRRHSLYKEPR